MTTKNPESPKGTQNPTNPLAVLRMCATGDYKGEGTSVSLELRENKVTVLVGPEGVGKTKLIELYNFAILGKDALPNLAHLAGEGLTSFIEFKDGVSTLRLGSSAYRDKYKVGEKKGQYKDEPMKVKQFLFLLNETTGREMPFDQTPSDYLKTVSTRWMNGIEGFQSKNHRAHFDWLNDAFDEEIKELRLDELDEKINTLNDNKIISRRACAEVGAFEETVNNLHKADPVANPMTWKKISALKDPKLSKLKAKLAKKDEEIGGSETEYELKVTKSKEVLKGNADECIAKIRELNEEETSRYNKKDLEYRHLSCMDEGLGEITQRAQHINWRENGKKWRDVKALIDTVKDISFVGLTEKLDPLVTVPITADNKLSPTITFADGKTFDGEEVYPEIYQEHIVQYLANRKQFQTLLTESKDENKKAERLKTLNEERELIVKEIAEATIVQSFIDKLRINTEWREDVNLWSHAIQERHDRYASINTGIPGLKIIPFQPEGSENYELWLAYNGEADPTFFGNPDGEYRIASEMSSAQMMVLAVMIHVNKMLRESRPINTVIVDGVAITERSIDILHKVLPKGINVLITMTSDVKPGEGKPYMINVIDGGVLLPNDTVDK